MADYSRSNSFSHPDDDDDNNNNNNNNNQVVERKRKGRPPGSKNKPKPTTIIIQVPEPTIEWNIAVGSDVINDLIQYACRRQVGIIVKGGIGSVTNVSIHIKRRGSSEMDFSSLPGPFDIVYLFGVYSAFSCSTHSPASASVSASTSASASTSSEPSRPPPTFFVLLSGPDGEVLSGNARQMTAASPVVVYLDNFRNQAKESSDNGELEESNNNNHFDFRKLSWGPLNSLPPGYLSPFNGEKRIKMLKNSI